jgi:hypothetical protein
MTKTNIGICEKINNYSVIRKIHVNHIVKFEADTQKEKCGSLIRADILTINTINTVGNITYTGNSCCMV